MCRPATVESVALTAAGPTSFASSSEHGHEVPGAALHPASGQGFQAKRALALSARSSAQLSLLASPAERWFVAECHGVLQPAPGNRISAPADALPWAELLDLALSCAPLSPPLLHAVMLLLPLLCSHPTPCRRPAPPSEAQYSPHSLPPLQLCCHGLRGHTWHRPAAPLLRQVPARGCSSQSRPCTHAAVDDSAGGTHHAAAVRWVGRHYHGAVGSTGVGSARS